MIVILGDINKTADLKTWVSIKGTVVTFNFTLKKNKKTTIGRVFTHFLQLTLPVVFHKVQF